MSKSATQSSYAVTRLNTDMSMTVHIIRQHKFSTRCNGGIYRFTIACSGKEVLTIVSKSQKMPFCHLWFLCFSPVFGVGSTAFIQQTGMHMHTARELARCAYRLICESL